MAVSKKYSRRIIVDGVAYRWRIPPELEYDQTDHDGLILVVVVWHEQTPGSMLRLIAGQHPGGRSFRRVGSHDTVTPRRVAMGIIFALEAGWQPTSIGRAFRMDLPQLPPQSAGRDDA